MFKKPQNFFLKGLTVNLVLGLLKQCFHVLIFFAFCGTNPYVLWNKFQDYQLRFISANQFLVTA